MEFVVIGSDAQWEALTAEAPGVTWTRAKEKDNLENHVSATAFFILTDNATFNNTAITQPVFINNVDTTLAKMNAGKNVFRVNGWNGFLKRTAWEIAGDASADLQLIAGALNKKLLPVADEPGLVAGRIVAMIINEAYFTVGDGISGKAETDTAMKLGTNYPYGPFEWASIIGIEHIYSLLDTLTVTDKRYTPALLLISEATKNK